MQTSYADHDEPDAKTPIFNYWKVLPFILANVCPSYKGSFFLCNSVEDSLK
nr:unnamed protein product [Callosobruchus analis]